MKAQETQLIVVNQPLGFRPVTFNATYTVKSIDDYAILVEVAMTYNITVEQAFQRLLDWPELDMCTNFAEFVNSVREDQPQIER